MRTLRHLLSCTIAMLPFATAASADDSSHPVMQWVKQHPQPGAKNPSPRLGYEASYGYDPQTRLLIRYGGHNQGGGGEQNSEVWTYDLDRDLWKYHEPNDSPPGVCCAQINVFHPRLRKFVRFPAFSGGHGWQSPREISLKNSSVWTYDLDSNTWAAMRPARDIMPSPLRGAAYDPVSDLIVLHGGEGARHGTIAYDLQTNSWHALNPTGQAPAATLSQPGFCRDAATGLFVCFGSQFASDPRTYVYSLEQNQWRVLPTATQPPFDKTSPVLAADSRNGIVLCLVRSAEKGKDVPLETWVLDVSKSQWRKLDIPPPDPSGSRSRILLYLPDRNLFVLENNTPVDGEREQQIWTFRYADAPQKAAAPEPAVRRIPDWLKDGIPAQTPDVPAAMIADVIDTNRVELRWTKAKQATGYIVERAPVAVYSNQQAARIAKRYADADEFGVGAVRAVGAFESITAEPVDVPGYADKTINLSAGQSEVDYPRVAGRELPAEQLAADGKPYRFAAYAYRVRGVDRDGVRSGPSPMVFTWPAAVANLKSKEEGKSATRLRWDRSPAKGIRGYLVYRQGGQYDKTPILRLTPEPITATEFLDEQAGEGTRRYEVVAVDFLGQQGEPTAPVWGRRQWARFYVPFIDEWHQ